MGPAVCNGPGAISMKENWVQGAPLHLHTQLHTSSEPHTTAAVNDFPLQLSLRTVYLYPSPWYGVQNTPVGQRVNGTNSGLTGTGYQFMKTLKISFMLLHIPFKGKVTRNPNLILPKPYKRKCLYVVHMYTCSPIPYTKAK